MFRDSSSDDSDEISTAAKLYILSNTSNRRFSAHPINESRQTFGEYHHLYQELKKYPDKFHDYLRMTPDTFNYILAQVELNLKEREYNNYHVNPITTEEMIVVAIRYLATGSSFRSLGFAFRIGPSTISKIVREICRCLWNTFQPIHMKAPITEDFLRIAERFQTKWNFPNCIGSLDGKHVRIRCPTHSGSMYFNYKQYFSIVLQALVDDHYRFVSVDVGGFGKQSDGGTFQASLLGQLIEKSKLKIPPESCLPNSNITAPFVFIADEAYPLKENLMKPFSNRGIDVQEEIFNKRLSRARKTVECAFGILFSKWRILSSSIETNEDVADDIIKAICVLHNIITDKEANNITVSDLPAISVNHHLRANRSNNPSSKKAQDIRKQFKHYFNTHM